MNKGYIYKIIINNQCMIYVGSTQNMRMRKSGHKRKCFNTNSSHYNLRVYKIIRDDFKIIRDDFNRTVDLVWIEDVNYNERHELRAREKYYIIELKPCGNINIPFDKCLKEAVKEMSKEYYEKNKDKFKEYYEKNKEKNKDKIKENKKKYYEKNIDKFKEYRKKNADKNKEYQKKYREENADKNKEYYEKNKDKFKEKNKKYRERNREEINRKREENREEINRKRRERYRNKKNEKTPRKK